MQAVQLNMRRHDNLTQKTGLTRSYWDDNFNFRQQGEEGVIDRLVWNASRSSSGLQSSDCEPEVSQELHKVVSHINWYGLSFNAL